MKEVIAIGGKSEENKGGGFGCTRPLGLLCLTHAKSAMAQVERHD